MARTSYETSTTLSTGLATAVDEERWSAFVATRPDASCSHLFGWHAVIRRAYRKTCYYLYVTDARQWLGVLPLVHLNGPLAGNRLVSLPYLDQGGILASSAEAAAALRGEAFRLTRQIGATGVDFRGHSGESSPTSRETRRFRFLLPLEDSEEHLWGAIGPKVRNQIRKSEGSGLVTRRVENDRLGDFYSVFARNMRDLGSPVHSRRFFAGIFSALGSAAALYLTFGDNDLPVGGGVALTFGNTVTVPWASSLRAARPACPNHSLYWKILRDAQRAGAEVFDFGRSSVGTGTFHFKKQWRAKPVPLIWEFYDGYGHREADRLLDPRKHIRLSNVWKRLPVSIATRLGPIVRRQLAN